MAVASVASTTTPSRRRVYPAVCGLFAHGRRPPQPPDTFPRGTSTAPSSTRMRRQTLVPSGLAAQPRVSGKQARDLWARSSRWPHELDGGLDRYDAERREAVRERIAEGANCALVGLRPTPA